MLYSRTLHQYFVQQPLTTNCRQFPQSLIYHYMDDILLADSKDALKKIQRQDSVIYLCFEISQQKFCLQKIQICREEFQSLNDLQKLIENVNWLRSVFGLSINKLKKWFQILLGESNLNSPWNLTAEAEKKS